MPTIDSTLNPAATDFSPGNWWHGVNTQLCTALIFIRFPAWERWIPSSWSMEKTSDMDMAIESPTNIGLEFELIRNCLLKMAIRKHQPHPKPCVVAVNRRHVGVANQSLYNQTFWGIWSTFKYRQCAEIKLGQPVCMYNTIYIYTYTYIYLYHYPYKSILNNWIFSTYLSVFSIPSSRSCLFWAACCHVLDADSIGLGRQLDVFCSMFDVTLVLFILVYG